MKVVRLTESKTEVHLMPTTDADLASALDTLRSEKLEEGPKLIALDSA